MSLSSELRELSELHEAGALTDSEFSEAKRRLLGKKQLDDPSQKSAVSTEEPPSMEWESENRDSWEAEYDALVAPKRPWGLVAYASINMVFAFLAIGSLLLNFESLSKIPYGDEQLFWGLIGACTLAGSSVAFLKGSGWGRTLLFLAAGFYLIDQVISHYQADEFARQWVGAPARYGATSFLQDLPALIWLLFPRAKSKWMRSLSPRKSLWWRGWFCIYLFLLVGSAGGVFSENEFSENEKIAWISFFISLVVVGPFLLVRARSEEMGP